MIIQWNGHSCFTLETAQGTVVLDPYAPGSVPGLSLPKLRADAVLCSHGHADHGYVQGVELSGRPCAVEIRVLPCFHDEVQGAKRGQNKIHILSAEGMRIAHLGDLGHDPDPEQLDQLRGADVLMIPVGGFYTIDARQAHRIATELCPRIVLPMHYRGDDFGYEVLSPVGDFLALTQGPVERYPGSSLEVTKDTPAQTAVLACPR